MKVFEKVLQETDKLEKEHPYKTLENTDAYDIYIEAWQDCLDDLAVGIIRSCMEDDGLALKPKPEPYKSKEKKNNEI